MGNEIKTKTPSNSPLMGRIERMVEEMCPEGVKWVKLGEVCNFITGFAFKASLFFKEGKPICKTTNIQNGEIDFSNMECFHIEDYDVNLDKYLINPQDIVIGMSGTIKVGINKDNISCYLNQRVGKFIPNHKFVNNKFLYFTLLNSVKILGENITGGSVKNLSNNDILNLQFPLPPLPIQEAIADILDKFDRLSAELQAELQARKQQYEYYRNQLLTRFAPDQPVTEYSLGDLGSLTRGRRFVRDDVRESGQPCIHYGDMYTYYGLHATESRTFLDRDFPKKMRYAEKGDVIIVGAGENDLDIGIGMVWEGDEPAAIHDACYILKHNINPRYIAHYLRTSFYHEQIRKYVNSAKICSISAENLAKAKILVPSLEEQARIVSILDKFEALVNDLSQGLPAEIAAVKEQYEYYRNKLLTFEKLA